jgi:hypothetical protein
MSVSGIIGRLSFGGHDDEIPVAPVATRGAA